MLPDLHVYRGGRLILKWDLDNQRPIAGKPSARVLELIRQIESEGLI